MSGVAGLEQKIRSEATVLADVVSEVSKVIVGQQALIERLLMGLLTGGHLLLEGVPGLAKSLAVETLARTLDVTFHRIQFTPDLLPADLTGTPVFQPQSGRFEVKKGPLFAHLVLADEVNRAPAKVHAALLEAMQERTITIGDQSFALPDPFLVLATQNPVEHEGTYALPEAELDRFFMKVVIGYPSLAEETEIVARMANTRGVPSVRKVADGARVLAARALVDQVHVEPRLVQYVLALVRATRDPVGAGMRDMDGVVRYGASPRASIALVLAARCHALLRGKDFAGPSDVKAIATDVLRHRILLSYEAEAEGVTAAAVVARVLSTVEVP